MWAPTLFHYLELNLHPSKCQASNHSWVDWWGWWEAEEEKTKWKIARVGLELGSQAQSYTIHTNTHTHTHTHTFTVHISNDPFGRYRVGSCVFFFYSHNILYEFQNSTLSSVLEDTGEIVLTTSERAL